MDVSTTTVVMIDVISKIDAMWASRMNYLLWVSGGILAFGGILMPYLLEKRSERRERMMMERIEDTKKNMEALIKDELKKSLGILEEKIQFVGDETFATRFMLFGTDAVRYAHDRQYHQSLVLIENALAVAMVCADSETKVARMLELLKTILTQIKELLTTREEQQIERIITLLYTHNQNGQFTTHIQELRTLFDEAKQRK